MLPLIDAVSDARQEINRHSLLSAYCVNNGWGGDDLFYDTSISTAADYKLTLCAGIIPLTTFHTSPEPIWLRNQALKRTDALCKHGLEMKSVSLHRRNPIRRYFTGTAI